MQDKTTRRPLIDPVLMLLKSRRVLISLVTLIVSIGIMLIPTLAPVQGEILVLIITLALALIGGYTVEDAVSIARQQPLPPDDLKALVHDVIEAVFFAHEDDEPEG